MNVQPHPESDDAFASSLEQADQDTRPNIEQANVDKMITAILVKMGYSEFENAYDEGRSMTLDVVYRFAFDETSSLIPHFSHTLPDENPGKSCT